MLLDGVISRMDAPDQILLDAWPQAPHFISCIAKCELIIHDRFKFALHDINLIIQYQIFSSYEETVDISSNIALEMIMLSYWSFLCNYIVNVIAINNFVMDIIIMIMTEIIVIIIIIVVVIIIVLFKLFQMLLNLK